jgi:hypothetical protein
MVYQALLKRNRTSSAPVSDAQAWSVMFGAMADLPSVRTVVDGQMRDMTALEIGRRPRDRYRSEQSPEALLRNTSPYVYFGLRDGRDEVSGFRKDYQQLRTLSLPPAAAALELASANQHQFTRTFEAELITDVRIAGSSGLATPPPMRHDSAVIHRSAWGRLLLSQRFVPSTVHAR